MAGEQRLWPLIVRTGSAPGIFLIRFDNAEEQEGRTHTHKYFTISTCVAVLISFSAADPGKNMKKSDWKIVSEI